ncbi:MAG: DUF3098 domain-containing protein [Candidatus Amulumruptor sp.]|nr:DUF3098 domain-containing protein [Candidatus Amulumruptor sp.]
MITTSDKFPNTEAANSTSERDNASFRSFLPLTRLNFILMAIAGAVIVAGFLLMTGAPSGADTFNPDIFSTRRIVVGPTIAFLGYIFMGAAIMWPSKSRKSQNTPE